MKDMIKMWSKMELHSDITKTGRPSKIDEGTRQNLPRKAAKTPTATIKELQEYLASSLLATPYINLS